MKNFKIQNIAHGRKPGRKQGYSLKSGPRDPGIYHYLFFPACRAITDNQFPAPGIITAFFILKNDIPALPRVGGGAGPI